MKTFRRLKQRFAPVLGSLIIGVFTYIALYAILATCIAPDQYDLRVGQVSPVTITASRDVEDKLATQQLIDQAVAAVQPTYISDNGVQAEVQENLTSAFNRLNAVCEWEADEDNSASLIRSAEHALAPMEIDEETLAWLLSIAPDELTGLREELLDVVSVLMTDKLAEGREEEAISKIVKDLGSAGFGEQAAELARDVLTSYLRPNLLVDEESFETRKTEAAASIEPIIYIKGRNIVKSGEIVTKAQIAMLDDLGMLKTNSSLDLMMMLGLALILLLLMMVLIIYMGLFQDDMLEDIRKMGLLSAIFLITMGLCVLCQEISVYLMPVTLGVMLTALLLKGRLALIVNLVLAVLCGLVAGGSSSVFSASMFSTMLTSIVSGSLCVSILRKRQQRSAVLLAGLGVAVSNVATVFAVNLLSSTGIMTDFMWIAWAAGSGLLAAVLCIGLQPALEWVFNLVTSAKLLELSNPNQPLIRRLIMEASGTYHHSIIVANLSEAAADSIGANGLLARVGAYYHDVGKLKRPLYFKENQMGDNPHDRTDPMVSTAILTAHPRDGAALAQKCRMPQPIIDIIEQHHGDTPVIYFYNEYVKQYGAENAKIEDFRYTGRRPQTREAAIVMLADTVEAAARAMTDPTLEKMDQLIRRLVRAKMDDGQLDESPLTMQDLDRICKAFLTVLTGVFHHRVEYPTVEIPKKGEPAKQAAPQQSAQADKTENTDKTDKAGQPAPQSEPSGGEQQADPAEEKADSETAQEQAGQAEEAADEAGN